MFFSKSLFSEADMHCWLRRGEFCPRVFILLLILFQDRWVSSFFHACKNRLPIHCVICFKIALWHFARSLRDCDPLDHATVTGLRLMKTRFLENAVFGKDMFSRKTYVFTYTYRKPTRKPSFDYKKSIKWTLRPPRGVGGWGLPSPSKTHSCYLLASLVLLAEVTCELVLKRYSRRLCMIYNLSIIIARHAFSFT